MGLAVNLFRNRGLSFFSLFKSLISIFKGLSFFLVLSVLTGFNQANPGAIFAKTVFRYKKKTAQKAV
jgi:hypothetical protein